MRGFLSGAGTPVYQIRTAAAYRKSRNPVFVAAVPEGVHRFGRDLPGRRRSCWFDQAKRRQATGFGRLCGDIGVGHILVNWRQIARFSRLPARLLPYAAIAKGNRLRDCPADLGRSAGPQSIQGHRYELVEIPHFRRLECLAITATSRDVCRSWRFVALAGGLRAAIGLVLLRQRRHRPGGRPRQRRATSTRAISPWPRTTSAPSCRTCRPMCGAST